MKGEALEWGASISSPWSGNEWCWSILRVSTCHHWHMSSLRTCCWWHRSFTRKCSLQAIKNGLSTPTLIKLRICLKQWYLFRMLAACDRPSAQDVAWCSYPRFPSSSPGNVDTLCRPLDFERTALECFLAWWKNMKKWYTSIVPLAAANSQRRQSVALLFYLGNQHLCREIHTRLLDHKMPPPLLDDVGLQCTSWNTYWFCQCSKKDTVSSKWAPNLAAKDPRDFEISTKIEGTGPVWMFGALIGPNPNAVLREPMWTSWTHPGGP